jgi:hypothetical protein
MMVLSTLPKRTSKAISEMQLVPDDEHEIGAVILCVGLVKKRLL